MTTASPKCEHCATWNDNVNRLKLTVTFDSYMKTSELFVMSKVPILTLTLTRSAEIEKTAVLVPERCSTCRPVPWLHTKTAPLSFMDRVL